MADSSFVQTNFIGGTWTTEAQTRTDLEAYKTALKQCTNSYPLISGPWTRRQGFQWIANTRQGTYGRLMALEFSYQTPFQIELTSGYMRVYLGQALLFTGDNNVTISAISTAKPAVVTVNGALPSAWANGDTVMFNFAQPMSAPILAGRQFTIASITTSTFALYDALTGDPIDGSTFAYTVPKLGLDYIYKVLEFTLPYQASDIPDVRMVKNGTTALLLHSKYQPQAITYGPGGLSVAAQDFTDGPYLDINTTATTLTPSGNTGSITLTASSTTGINNGYGFALTDIGRLVRFQSAPAAWASGTTYAKDATVLGSDNNIYQSVAGSNTGNNPTTDTGANWVLTGDVVTWTWLKITAWTSSTVVTATVEGADLPSTAATTSWALGLYSDTTGWPSNGTWDQSRFWLISQVNPNRVDASVSNDDFNFAPTASDGTVGDANALAETYLAPDNNESYWLQPRPEGVIIGTKSGEWLVRASNLGDPITPTSIQIKPVSKYGCANVDPVVAQLTTVFVQRSGRKILDYDHYPYGETAGWFAADLTLYSSDLTVGGIEELRYQDQPNKMLWGRRTDGTLVSCTFQHAPYGRQSYNGWHDHTLGGSRTVSSISSGIAADGIAETLFLTCYNPTTGYYESLVLSAQFDAGVQPYAMCFTDGVAQAAGSYVMQTANGDSFDGLRIYGLGNLVGQTVTPQIIGLDLGDFVVAAGGYIDIPFNTTTFTKAILEGYNDGTSYGTLALPVATALPAAYSSDGAGAYVGSTTGSLTDTQVKNAWLDKTLGYLVVDQTDGLRIFDALSTTEIKNASFGQICGPAAPGGFTAFNTNYTTYYHPGNRCYYAQVGTFNSNPLWKIDTTTMKLVKQFGISSGSLGGSTPTRLQAGFNTFNGCTYGGVNYLWHVGITASSTNNEIALLDGDNMKLIATYQTAEAQAYVAPGYEGSGQAYAIGTVTYGAAQSASFSLYSLAINAPNWIGFGFDTTKIASIAPSTIDSTWTNFSSVQGLIFDPTDGNVIVQVNTTDAVTNQQYLVKLNSATGAIVWKTATTSAQSMSLVKMDLVQPTNGTIAWFSGSGSNWYSLNTGTGTITTTAFSGVTDMVGYNLYWPEQNAQIGEVTCAYSSPPTLLGAYAEANSGGWTGKWSLLTLGAPVSNTNWPPPANYNYMIPGSIGVNYTTQAQLLKPDFGPEAGARNGPAFGKTRRAQRFAVDVLRGETFDLGTQSSDLKAVSMYDLNTEATDTGSTLYTGTIRDMLDDDYSFDYSIIWQVSRPTPLTLRAVGGFIHTQDL